MPQEEEGMRGTAAIYRCIVGDIGGVFAAQNPGSVKPAAYLNWILLDEQLRYDSSSSGFEQVGSKDVLNTHTRTGLSVNKNDIYIFT